MAKWKKLRRGRKAKQVTFCARAVDSVARLSSIRTDIAVSHEGAEQTNSAACREPEIINLNNADPYGCLQIRRSAYSRTSGAFLNRDVEKGEALALFTKVIISEDDQYVGRECRFVMQGKTPRRGDPVG